MENNKRELVRILVAEHGHKKAAELSGVNYSLVRQWESRRKRNEAKLQALSQSSQKPLITRVADKIDSELKRHRESSSLNLATWTSQAAKEAATAIQPLAKAKLVRDVAYVHSVLWPQETSNKPLLNVALLCGEVSPRRLD